MTLSITVNLDYTADAPCPVLMQLTAADQPAQSLIQSDLQISSGTLQSRAFGNENIGERHWIDVQSRLTATYAAEVAITRPNPTFDTLAKTPLHALASDAIPYLMSSRYCPADAFGEFLAQFRHLEGGARVQAIAHWCRDNLTYDNTASTSQTTAQDTLNSRRGVCRDFAHLLIALCRCSAIPARFASVYSPDVTPQDFHAVAEVYLDNAWHLIDPTGMATADEMALIGVGRDAADVAFLTAYGILRLSHQSVAVTRLPNPPLRSAS